MVQLPPSGPSHPPPAYTTTSSSSFATLSFDSADKLRLVQFPFPLATAISTQLKTWWPAGIQRERIYAVHSYEFKLKGWPFGGIALGKDYVKGMRLVRDLLAFLYERGWVVEVGLAHEKAVDASDTLVFRQRRRGGKMLGGEKGLDGGEDDIVIPPEADWLVLSLEASDRLRVIYDPPSGVVRPSTEEVSGSNEKSAASSSEMPREHDYDELGVLIQALKEAFIAIDYFQSGKWTHDSFEFKLKGWAWSEVGEKAVKVRRLVLGIIETMERFGWRSYTTLQKRGQEKVRGTDTWFFVREKGWDGR
jgi:hypothetical protein